MRILVQRGGELERLERIDDPPDLLMEERSTISSSEPGFLTFTGGATAERSIQYLTCCGVRLG